MKKLKPNDPVMWKRNEYKFIEYSPIAPRNEGVRERVIIQRQGDSFTYEVPTEEVDLIQEFNFVKE